MNQASIAAIKRNDTEAVIADLDSGAADNKRDGTAFDLEALPYRMRDDFLSSAELSFCHVLVSAIGNRVTVCPKVRLAA